MASPVQGRCRSTCLRNGFHDLLPKYGGCLVNLVRHGLGFSKTVEQNILLFDQLEALQALGRPVLVGPSRKRFLGAVTGQPLEARDRATATACALAWERGARLFRVHDVASARDALTLAQALGGP